MIRRILLFLFVAWVIYYLTTDPSGAASTVEAGLRVFKSIAAAIGHILPHGSG